MYKVIIKTPVYCCKKQKTSPLPGVLSYFLAYGGDLLEEAVLRRHVCPQRLLGPKVPSASCLRSISNAVWRARWSCALASQDCVFSTFLHTESRKNSWPSSHNPPMFVRMKGRLEVCARRRPFRCLLPNRYLPDIVWTLKRVWLPFKLESQKANIFL